MTSQTLKFAGVAAATIAATIWGGYEIGHSVAPAATAATPVAIRSGQPLAAAALPDFGSIVESYGPAVVNISVEGTVKTTARGRNPFGQLDPDDPFSEFFRRFAPRGKGKPSEQITHGQGSGFIVSADGIVLTNAHVVADANNVTVKLTDKREFTAKVVGIDKQTDIAVLRIDAQGLPTVPLGDPADLRVGDWVLAIGSPFGFENSVTAGIVSAKSRSLPDEGYVPFLQTDVAINPGNSGGPLLNLKGEVVGINSQIYSQSGGYQGLSFAIPINVAAHVKDQLLAQGKVTRGRLGIAIQDLNQGLADSFGLSVARGALVSHVEAGSPAAAAGLEAGDVVLKFNGEPIASSAELPPRVAVVTPGKPVKLEIWRKGKALEITVTVGEQQPDKVAAADEAPQPDDGGRLGVSVRPLTNDEQKATDTRGGLLVLDSSGPASRAGIEEGDVILAVNGKQVHRVDELRKQLADAGKHVALLIQRGDARIFVPIELG
ncbi:Do family serine endopeptidase [Aromatoleum toluvorans]|uniref:Probable periplasmic serine endoprotease DegP-like n=1 Tax=Aromatoleum toluvorans TaxID=92002 RepID=A0ABX1PW29_9RHOO|nr:DegQ family serine endoprotease [Aromatoleum toluvorans]NMG43634.1 Do family serine endopeptidase [Aromatoleum toluvorans]